MAKKSKPVPTDMREWITEVCGIHRFLSRVEVYKPGAGEPWVSKQQVYYKSRLNLLLSSKPPLPSKPRWRRLLEKD